jgi:hypothetical protein
MTSESDPIRSLLGEYFSLNDENGVVPTEKLVKKLIAKFDEMLHENTETKKILVSFCKNTQNKNIVYESIRQLAELAREMYSQKERESDSFQRKMTRYCDAFHASIEDDAEMRHQLLKFFEPGSYASFPLKLLINQAYVRFLSLKESLDLLQEENKVLKENMNRSTRQILEDLITKSNLL